MTRKTLLALFAALAMMTTALMAAPGSRRRNPRDHRQWKPEATQAQIDAALRAAENLNYAA
jgi:hypothetical protein